MSKRTQQITSGDNSINIQGDHLLINIDKTNIIYDRFVPKTIEDLIYNAKQNNDFKTAIELIDLTINDKSYELEKNKLSELILKKAALYQQSGNILKAVEILKEYNKKSSIRSREYYLCVGKIISQRYSNPNKLFTYLQKLEKHPVFIKDQNLLTSLYWRLSVLYQPCSAIDSEKNLLIHRDYCKPNSYQIPHNYQCSALTSLTKATNGKIFFNNISKVKSILYDAYEMYTKLSDFPFLDKCIISNLLIIALADNLQGRTIQYYKKLFFCRNIFILNSIKYTDEAMSEIFYSINVHFPEAFQILFTENISKFILKNSMCKVIKDLYIEVYNDFTYMKKNNISVMCMYNEMNKII